MQLHNMCKGVCMKDAFQLSQTLSRTNFPRQIIPLRKDTGTVFKREFADVGAGMITL